MTFTVLIGGLVESAEENHHIGLTGFLHRLGSEFGLRACLIKRPAYRHAVEALNRITDIAAGVVTLNIDH